jgi:hypothetical protein
MSGAVSPAGFIVLNGTVTRGSFAGPPAKQLRRRRRVHFVGRGTPARTGECVNRVPEAARGWAGDRPLVGGHRFAVRLVLRRAPARRGPRERRLEGSERRA